MRERRAEPTETREVSWAKPEPRWATGPDGRRMRVYQCAGCRDVGLITLPTYRPGETDEDLLHPERAADGKRYVSFCPDCRGVGDSTRPGEAQGNAQLNRLGRWSRARRAELEAERREAMPAITDARAAIRDAVAGAAKAMKEAEPT